MDEPTERALIERAQAGDKEAFNQLAACYQEHIYRYAMMHLYEHDKSMEAMQRTLIFAWQNLGKFTYKPGGFVFWLLAACRRHNREVERDYERGPEQLLGEHEASAEPPPCDDPPEIDPASVLEGQMLEAWTLKEEGYGNAEIARRLCVKPGTVRDYIKRARRKLKFSST